MSNETDWIQNIIQMTNQLNGTDDLSGLSSLFGDILASSNQDPPEQKEESPKDPYLERIGYYE